MMLRRKMSARAEYRLRENERVSNSISLAEKFPKLESLMVNLLYFDPEGLRKTGEVKYKVNVQHARSVFSFVCPVAECICGGFDLSEALARAVAARRRIVEGENRCPGFRLKAKVDKFPCRNLLRYKLTLGYVRG